MKVFTWMKFMALVALVVATSAAYGQVDENFDGWNDNSYGGVSTYTDSDGGQWETNNTFCGSENARSGNGIRFNDDSGANEYLLYSGLDGNGKDNGIGTIAFWYRHWDGDGSTVEFQVQYNQSGSGWTNIGSVVSVTSTTYMEFSQVVDLSGDDILVRVISIEDEERLMIDDFSITNFAPTCSSPSTQASNFSVSNISASGMDVNWDDGNGDRVLVVAKEGGPVDTDPTDGTSYTANASFGSGDELGTGNFVVYDAAGSSPGGSSVSVTGLSQGATYHFAIYSYNSADDCYNLDELTGSATTLGPDIQLEYPVGTDVDCGSLIVDFGAAVSGVGTTTQTFRISNDGTSDLNLTIPLTIDGANSGDFTILTQPSAVIAAGSFSDVQVQFAPSEVGARMASISIVSDDGDENPCDLDLTGVGTIANDDCTNATLVTVNAGGTCTLLTAGSTVGATDSGVGAISCNGFTGDANDDVWFQFVATATSHNVSVIVSATLDAVLDVRSGSCDGVNIACSDDGGSGTDEEVDVTGLTIGATYYIRVYSYSNDEAAFDVCVSTPPPPANPGDIVINEFMAATDCGFNSVGEYFELYNTTASAIDIDGWVMEDDGSDDFIFSSSTGTTVIPAGGYLLCAITSNASYFGTVTVDYDYDGYTLANNADELVLRDGSTEICRVDYTDGDPFGTGVSLQLPEGYDYSLADDGVITAGEFVAPDSPFGCGDLGTPGEANILPVNLLAFNAKEFGTEVLLSFSTTSEQNNSHFLIQRSLDGRTFETIGRVEGKGDSNEQVDYSFVDTKPAAGLNYYRLQQFDFDGTNAFFGPVAVRFGGAETTKPQVWPVPATDVLQVELPAQDASWNLEVFTINGQLLLEKVVTEKGAQTSFDISALPAGSYFLRWANGREMGQIRFVKQ